MYILVELRRETCRDTIVDKTSGMFENTKNKPKFRSTRMDAGADLSIVLRSVLAIRISSELMDF